MTNLGPREASEPLDARGLSKLRWRCRRGMLENDLFLDRFFERYAASLTAGQANALTELMRLNDNDLLDLHLARRSVAEVDVTLDREEVVEVLKMLRNYY